MREIKRGGTEMERALVIEEKKKTKTKEPFFYFFLIYIYICTTEVMTFKLENKIITNSLKARK